MPTKRLLDARRSRKGLPRGFGWIDHRLLRDGYLGHCSPEALALYVFLSTIRVLAGHVTHDGCSRMRLDIRSLCPAIWCG
jgi:hypothetical protein